MTLIRSGARATGGRARRRRRFGSITGLVALLSALLVTGAVPARAIEACADPNLCPLANEDDYNVDFGLKLTVPAPGVLANDQGPAGTHVSVADTDTESLSGAASVAVKSDGSFTYTPDLSDPLNAFSGVDSFDYTIVDDAGHSDLNTVIVNVVPVVRDDVYGMPARLKDSDLPLIVGSEFGVLANDGGIDPFSLVFPTETPNGATIANAGFGAFVYTPVVGFHGIDTFQYTGTDLAFDTEPVYTGTVTIYVDGTPPVPTMAPLGPVTLATKVPIAWSATDDTGGPLTYDVQQRVAPWNSGFAPWSSLRTATSAKSTVVTGTYGRTFCFRVRAKDEAGNTALFTTPRCTSVPIRARSLEHSSRWARTASSLYFSGEAVATSYKGQSLTLPAVQAQHMWLVATKCATCGTMQIRWNNVVIANVNLASPTTVHRKLIPIASFAAPRTGTLSMYVTSPTGKVVKVEGLAVLHA